MVAIAIATTPACDVDEHAHADAPQRTTTAQRNAHLPDISSLPTRAVHAAVPWARVVSPVERVVSSGAPPRTKGDMVLSAEPEVSAALGEPRGALLYLAMDGMTLRPCDEAWSSSSAKQCTSIVDQTTEFPAWGTEMQQAMLLQYVTEYFAPFDVTVTTEKPPPYMPYTLQVIGGTPDLIDRAEICGIASLDCGAFSRNLVGLVFAQQDVCTPWKTTAHEAGHNFGLEHTVDDDDIMSYTLVYDDLYHFRDACMAQYLESPEDSPSCGMTHAQYCPEGGDRQNSRTELLGTLGPSRLDVSAPVVDVEPADGSVFTTTDTIRIGAQISDDGNFIGARWTWIGGLPDELPFGHDRCTNDACVEDFADESGDPDGSWDYLVLQGAPAGEYMFALEVMDTHGNESSTTIEFTVNGAPLPGAGESGGSSSGGDDDTGPDDSSTGGDALPMEQDEPDALPPGFGAATSSDGCSVGALGSSPWLLVLFGLWRSRRRRNGSHA